MGAVAGEGPVMQLFYDRDGRPIGRVEWQLLLMSGEGYERIAETTIGDVYVSTVWLGLNHAAYVGEPPLIFETMIFGGCDDGYQCRYSSESAAIEGHETTVAWQRAMLE